MTSMIVINAGLDTEQVVAHTAEEGSSIWGITLLVLFQRTIKCLKKETF